MTTSADNLIPNGNWGKWNKIPTLEKQTETYSAELDVSPWFLVLVPFAWFALSSSRWDHHQQGLPTLCWHFCVSWDRILNPHFSLNRSNLQKVSVIFLWAVELFLQLWRSLFMHLYPVLASENGCVARQACRSSAEPKTMSLRPRIEGFISFIWSQVSVKLSKELILLVMDS